MSTDSRGVAIPVMRTAIRWSVCSLGAVLILGAAALAYLPPTQDTIEYDGTATVVKREVREVAPSSLSVSLLGGGILLILFGANGLPLLRITGPGFGAETHPIDKLVKDFYRDRPELLQESETQQHGDAGATPAGREEDASASPPAASTIEQNGVTVKVYDLESVPAKLMADVIDGWPGDTPPLTLGILEFASKPVGQGNRPWTVQFRGFPPVSVTYGGRGNQDTATVRLAGRRPD